MTLTRVADYLSILAKSKLLPADVVSTVAKNWKGGDGDVEALRKSLVVGKHLTEYQSIMIGRGHADGFQIGGYVVQDRIGKGQSAGVYLGKHPSGQVVALKVLPRSKSKNANVLGRFQREGRLLTSLDHPNVVRAFQIGSAGDVHFIAMEHLHGETLDDVLVRRKKLPSPEACRLVDQLLDGLEHLFENRMIHRDVKPANLMVVPAAVPGKPDTTLSSTLKLVDIGLGRELFAETDDEAPELNLTREGAILGTPDYLAPEQARDARQADIRSDIYAAGCVLFRCLTGRPPFIEKNVMAQMVKHATEPAPRLADFAPDAPRGLQLVLDKMLAKDPASRYQTPFAAAEALQLFLPEQNNQPVGTSILPAFQTYLTESNGEMPAAGIPTPKRLSTAETPMKPLPKVIPAAVMSESAYNVELLTPTMTLVPPDEHETKRTLLPLDRRDWMMLTAGFGFSCLAIGTGYALSQIAGRKKVDEEGK